ncbi:MAG: hypothetical protein ACXVCY_02320 [Pseudobdellovibrionaceae bacterium]
MSSKLFKMALGMTTCLILSQPLKVLAGGGGAEGGVAGGGGAEIEGGFKASAVKLAEDLSKLNPVKKSLLTFDVDQFAVVVENFTPKCLINSDKLSSEDKQKLDFMQTNSKPAYVFPDEINKVYLDCDKYNFKHWQQNVFDVNSPKIKVFIGHEILRLMGLKGEDQYLYSSSISKAFNYKPKNYSEQLANIVESKYMHWGQKCYLTYEIFPGLTRTVNFNVDGKTVYTGELDSFYADIIISYLLEGANADIADIRNHTINVFTREKFLQLVDQYQCVQ